MDHIEGVPEGWRLIAIRKMRDGERFLDSAGRVRKFCEAVDPERVAPVVEEVEPTKPKYRPFSNAAEFAPHRDRWWRFKEDKYNQRRPPASYNDRGYWSWDWKGMFEDAVFDDGTPFGVEVKE